VACIGLPTPIGRLEGGGEGRIHFVGTPRAGFTWVWWLASTSGDDVSAFGLPDWLETKCRLIPRVKSPKIEIHEFRARTVLNTMDGSCQI